MRSFLEALVSYFRYRSHYLAIPGFAEAYEAEIERLAVFRVRVILTLGFFLYLSVSWLDHLLYPEQAPFFLILRVVFAVLAVIGLLLTRTSWGQKNSVAIFFAFALYGELAVSMMITQIGGWKSLYFVGNILVSMSATLFIPWRPRVTLIYCLTSLVGYIGLNAVYHPVTVDAMIPINFLILAMLLFYFAAIANEISRMGQLASRFDIEKAHIELKYLTDAKTKFFANISHELRTPLTLIIGPLSSAAKSGGALSPQLIASMTANAQRLLRQVNALLDLGKVDAENMSLNLEVGNVKALATDLCHAAEPGAREQGVRLELRGPDPFPDSRFDFEKIETVLANLISNAIKFTPREGLVQVQYELEGRKTIRLSVKDTGPGIAPAHHDKIFQRFQQVDDTAKKFSKGTGLGLSVAKEFVELHGGRIWVDSQLGKGTEFFVEFPFREISSGASVAKLSDTEMRVRKEARATLLVDVSATEGAATSDEMISLENQQRFRKRSKSKPVVLYVDDNADLRDYVEGILSPHYTVLLAQDGAHGLEQARLYEPELILSDVMMPKMDGFELCQRVRADQDLKSIPFVLLTANSSLDSKIAGLKDGADDYLGKPFSELELLARVKNLVHLRQHATLMKKQVNAARAIQRALLPQVLQDFGRFEVAAIYEPCEELSGDFFDTLVTENWLYVYVADVTGHGIAAAQVTYLVKEIFKQVLTHDIGLVDLFDKVRASYVSHKLDYDLGLQLLRANLQTGRIEFLRSNAADPFLVTRDGQSRLLEVPVSPLISAAEKGPEGQVHILGHELRRGEALYLYSDGAFEFTQANGKEYGQRRLGQALASSHSKAWPVALMAELRGESRDSTFPDDLTILRLQMKAGS